jgi:hypothetical protein
MQESFTILTWFMILIPMPLLVIFKLAVYSSTTSCIYAAGQRFNYGT